MVRRGGIYCLNENYILSHDALYDKRPIIVLNAEKTDTFFSAVRMGIFKTGRNDKNSIFIELKVQGNKYFTSILCDKVLEIPKSAIKEEIGTLDERTLKVIEDELFHRNYGEKHCYKEVDSKVSKSVDEYIKADAEQQILQANVTIEDQEKFKKILINTNEIISLFMERETQKEIDAKKRKKYKWISFIISNAISFILGVLASYTATHFDKEISTGIENCVNVFKELLEKL